MGGFLFHLHIELACCHGLQTETWAAAHTSVLKSGCAEKMMFNLLAYSRKKNRFPIYRWIWHLDHNARLAYYSVRGFPLCFWLYLFGSLIPTSPLVKNPPTNAGDMGSFPDLGRSHSLQSKAHAAQLLSPCSRAHEPQLLKPTCLETVLHNKKRNCTEQPPHLQEELALPGCN